MLTSEVKYINRQLRHEFGLFGDKTRFRIVWTGDEFEKREADYEDWLGDTLIRRVHEVRETPKYPYINPPWWMLERAVEFQDDSVKNPNFYEPLYVFHQYTEKGDFVRQLEPRADMAIYAAKLSLLKRPKRTLEMDKREFEEKEARGEKDIYEQICDQTSYLAHQFHHGEAIVMDGKSAELPTSPNLRSVE